MRKRSVYRPRPIRIPVTGLRNEFGLVLHAGITAAERGHFTRDQYDRIGSAINCIYGALMINPMKHASALAVIEGAIRAMNDAGRRGDATGIWVLRRMEQAAVLAGVHKAEEVLPTMDVMNLYESMQRLKELRAAENA